MVKEKLKTVSDQLFLVHSALRNISVLGKDAQELGDILSLVGKLQQGVMQILATEEAPPPTEDPK